MKCGAEIKRGSIIFYEAAYRDTPVEFEAVSVLLEQFLHTTAFPIEKGYCGFMIQDVTAWLAKSSLSIHDISVNLFFYDISTDLVMLAPSTSKIYGLNTDYVNMIDLACELFGPRCQKEVQGKVEKFKCGTSGFLYEGQLSDGRWLRLGMSYIGKNDLFGLGIIEDITRLKKTEEDNSRRMIQLQRQKAALEDALALAEHANAAKSTFLTNMSHDFRTPMNSISGFTSIALANLDNPKRVEDCLNKIALSCDHLLSLVNDILDMSRVESGKMVLTEEEMNLSKVCEGVQTMFSGQASQRNMNFSVHLETVSHPDVVGDELRLNQILMNIVGNAFKFTNDGGTVEFSCTELENPQTGFGLFEFRIADSGCGMKPGFEDSLFKPFEREESDEFAHTEGSGLGLAITKNLIEMMGGTIHVESTLGVGSTFTVLIPLKLSKGMRDSNKKRSFDHKLQRGVSFAGKRALVADDDELSREIMAEVLKSNGFSVEEVSDGDEAVHIVTASPVGYFDLIMMDMRMKRMDGDEATRAIRALDRVDVKTIPIVAVTADAFDEGIRRAKSAGMSSYTTKPLNMQEVISTLTHLLLENDVTEEVLSI